MPIRLFWTPPDLVGTGILGYAIYKTTYPGPLIKAAHLLQLVEGDVTEHEDDAYDRNTLHDPGYIYKVTSLTDEVESSFTLSNVVHITYSFEDFVSLEQWEEGIFAFTSSGGLTSGGVALVHSHSHAFVATGGLTSGGDSLRSHDRSYSATGGITSAGGSISSHGRSYSATGGITSGGQGNTTRTQHPSFTGTGGITSGGQASTNSTHTVSYSGSGGSTFAGSGLTQLHLAENWIFADEFPPPPLP